MAIELADQVIDNINNEIQNDVQMKKKNFFFKWGRSNYLEIYGKTEKEAMVTAHQMGWEKSCWWKPTTWGNSVIIWSW
jgi:hypothetical protein